MAGRAAETHRMVLPVRMRIHCGIGRFCFSFLASVFFVFIDLLAGCGAGRSRAGKQHEREAGGQHIVRSREEGCAYHATAATCVCETP